MDLKIWKIVSLVLVVVCVALLVALICTAVIEDTDDGNKETEQLEKRAKPLMLQAHPRHLIEFRKGDYPTFKSIEEELNTILEGYSNEQIANSEHIIDCAMFNAYLPENMQNKSCRFDLANLGSNCVKQQFYGYEDAFPCVLFSLNKVEGWLPEDFDDSLVPCELKSIYQKFHIPLTCEGETYEDKKFLGDVIYFPPGGFPFKFFPYNGRSDYMPPLVFAQFLRPSPFVRINVTCKVWGPNITPSNFEPARFQLYIE